MNFFFRHYIIRVNLCVLFPFFLFSQLYAIGQSAYFSFKWERGIAIKNWGVTVSPMDWDGTPMADLYEPYAGVESLIAESGATVVRYEVGTGGLPGNAPKILVEPLRRLRSVTNIPYILSFVVPPSYIRNYRSDAYFVEGAPNYIRIGNDAKYADHVVSVLKKIEEAKLDLPLAVSIQSSPDTITPSYFGAGTFIGCPFVPERWLDQVKLTRQRLDNEGLGFIKLIGPEVSTPSWLREMLYHWQSKNGLSKAPFSLAISNIQISKISDFEHFGNIVRSSSAFLSTDIWNLSPGLAETTNDQDVILASFQQMFHSLVDLRVNHWFWRYAFTPRLGAESWISKELNNPQPIFTALKFLWRKSPPGCIVNQMSKAGDASGVTAFSLRSEKSVTVVVINESTYATKVSLKELPPTMSGFLIFRNGNIYENKTIVRVNEEYVFEVGSRSLAILSFEFIDEIGNQTFYNSQN